MPEEKRSRLKLWLSIIATCISIATGSLALLKACEEEPISGPPIIMQPNQQQIGSRCCTFQGACIMVSPPQGPVGSACTCSTMFGMFQGTICQ